MLTQIKQWVEPPYFEGDEDKTNQTRIANTLIIYLGAALLVVVFILIPLFAFQKIGSWIIAITILCGLVIGRRLMFQGRFRLGGTLIFAILYLCILAMLILSGGSSNTAMFYFATVVLIAGYFLDARVVNGFTIATFLIAMGVSYLQEHGLVTIPKVFVFNSVFSWLATGIGLLFMIRTRDLFVGNLKSAIASAQRKNATLQETEALLRENEEKFKAQYKGIPIPTYSWKALGDDLILMDYNNAAFKFTHGRIVNLIGKTASAVYSDDPETFNELIECRRTKSNSKRERWHRLASTGESKYIAINYAFVPPDFIMVHTEDITDRKRIDIHNLIIAEVQDILLHPCELKDIYRLVSEKVKELIGDGITATSILDEQRRTVRMGYYHGVDIPFEKLLSVIGFDPWQKDFSLDDTTEEDLRIYRSGRLGILQGGLYTLMTHLIPQPACVMIEKLLRVQKIYAMGFIHKEAHLGALIILARSDITPHIAAIEQIVNLATIAIERKRAEEALEQSESKYRRMVETANEGIIVFDRDIRMTLVNQQMATMLGYTVEELLGRKLESLLFEEDLDDHRVQMQARTQGQGAVYERCFRRKDGGRLWTLVSATATTDSEGNFNGAFGMITDITERKRAEEKFAKAFQASPTIIVITRLSDGHMIDVNESFEQIIGYTRAEALGHTVFELGIWENPAEREHLVPILLANGRLRNKEVHFRNKKGETITCMYSSELIELNGEKCALAVIEDITARKHMEEDLRESEAKFRAVVENSNDGILFGDANAVIHYRSPSYNRINGYTDEERVGHSGFETVHPDHVGNLRRWWGMMLEHPEISHRTEYQIQHKDGTWRWIDTSGQNLLSNPDVHSVVVTSRDITERKHAEDALQTERDFALQILNNMGQGLTVTDQEGRFEYVNPTYARVIGHLPEKLVGKSPNDFTVEVDRVILDRARAQRRQGEINTYETRLIHQNGSEVPVTITGVPRWREGKIIGAIAVVTNLTERKRAEEALQESEKKYRELFEVNKDGIAIFLLHPHGLPSAFVEVNNAAHQMLGYSREEMLKLTPMMLEPDTTPEQLQFRQSEFESKGTTNFETILLDKNGNRVFTEFSAQLIQYEGQPAIMNIVRNITERKQRETELQAIATLSTALRTAPTRAEMLPVIIEQLVILFNCDAASIEIIDPLNGDSVTEVAHGAWKSLIGIRQKNGTGINAIISQTRQPYTTNDLKNDLNLAYPEWTHAGLRGGIGTPLIAQDNLIGFVSMGRKTKISESDVRLLASIADIAANAIHRATLHEQTQKDAADLALAYDSTLEGWAHALELRDQETEGHTRRVTQMTVDLAFAMGIGEGELEHIRRGALLHDIGKMGIPDAILRKPGALDESEWVIMKQHPEYAYKLLEPIEYLRPVLDIPYYHHERWDGSGYPHGLKGEDIPLAARIFAIVDVWDALTSDRPYRTAWAKEKALTHIKEQSRKHFDPAVVKAFMEIV